MEVFPFLFATGYNVAPMATLQLSPHPGLLPIRQPPTNGDRIVLQVDGLPPYKDRHFSIRNPRHKIHDRFLKLREIAAIEMKGRQWSDGPIAIRLCMFAPQKEKGRNLLSYVGGIMDTLDGSHGRYFTYLPVVYQDDCQVLQLSSHFEEAAAASYTVEIEFTDCDPRPDLIALPIESHFSTFPTDAVSVGQTHARAEEVRTVS